MDGTRRTYYHAFPAETAFVEIDVCHIVLDSYGSERTLLLTFAASDAGCLAGLARNCTLVLVHAADKYPAALRTLVAQLDDILRASLDTGAAAGAFLLVHDRKPRDRIHGESSELAGRNTIPASETAERTSGVTAVEGSLDLAGLVSAVLIGLRPVFTSSVAADHSDHGSLFRDFHTEDGSNFLHNFIASDRTEIVVQIRGFNA